MVLLETTTLLFAQMLAVKDSSKLNYVSAVFFVPLQEWIVWIMSRFEVAPLKIRPNSWVGISVGSTCNPSKQRFAFPLAIEPSQVHCIPSLRLFVLTFLFFYTFDYCSLLFHKELSV